MKKECNGTSKIVLMLLLVVAIVISIITLITVNKMRSFEVMRSGGQENMDTLDDIFETEQYKEQQTAAIEQSLQAFKGAGDVAAPEAPEIPEAPEAPSVPENAGDILAIMDTIKNEDVIKGDKDARFTILEYSDFLCTFCQRHHNSKTLDQVVEKYPGTVNTIFRNFPIVSLHPSAPVGAEGLLCANKVGSDEEYLAFVDKAFQVSSFNDDVLIGMADEVGLDGDDFKECLDSDEMVDVVNAQIAEGSSFGVTGTPGNVIVDNENGKYVLVPGAYPVDKFVEEIENLMN